MSTATEWVACFDRVPDDRRRVHCWGYIFVGGFQRHEKGSYLGPSRCNISRSGSRFDIERGGAVCTYVVTHWAEIVGP